MGGGKEIERLKTNSNEAVENFNPEISARERRKLELYARLLEEKNSKNKKKEPAEGDDDDSGGEGYGGDEGNDQDDHGGDDDDSNDSHDSEDEAQGLSAKRMKCGGDNPIYEGQMLLAERLLEERKAKGTTLYLVRWHDRDATYDTWESGKYIGKPLLDRFKRERKEA